MKSLLSIITLSLFMSLFPSMLKAQDQPALPDSIIQYDIRKYNSENLGIKDLVFEARIDQLTETLNKNLALGKLVDVHFKIYWMAPNEWKIDVNGLPKGFEEIKSDLRQLISGKLEYIMPKPFKTSLVELSFEQASEEGRPYLKAFDPNFSKPFTEMRLYFDSSSKLTKILTLYTQAKAESTFDYATFPWSNNKIVLTKQSTVSSFGASQSTITHSFEYVNVNGFGFPSKMAIKTNNKITVPARGKEKEKVLSSEMNSVIKFSKYETNTGKAKRYIVDGLQK